MEILVITWNYPPRRGGMEQLLARLCEGLSRENSVTVITAYGETVPSEDAGKIYRALKPGLVSFFFYALRQGRALLRANRKISIVFGGSVLVAPLVLLLARIARRRAVVLAHGLDLIYRSAVYQELIVRWLPFVDLVIANSQHTAGLARSKGVAERSVTVIPPGVDAASFAGETDCTALKQVRGLNDRKIILFVGRLARRKGVKEFIEHSLTQIVTELPEALFLIVGENPTESLAHHDDVAGEIRNAVARQGLDKHVRMLGAVGDCELKQIYSMCDLLVLPVLDISDDVEGFGMVALEAAAAGKPVVATRVGGVLDAVADGESGILVAAGDYSSLSQAVVVLLRDPERSRAMGERGATRARDEFAWGKICQRYSAAFHSVGVAQ